MGTVMKDEAAILKVLERNGKGIRSTDLWFAVRKSVRSLTTFQKRLKHLEQMGRIQTKDDLDDMRATIIAPTEKSAGAVVVLKGIEYLELLYLGRRPKGKLVLVSDGKEHEFSLEEERDYAAGQLLAIGYKAFTEARRGEYVDPFVRIETNRYGVNFLTAVPRVMLEAEAEDARRLNQIEIAIFKSAELTRLMEAEGFVMDRDDGIRKKGEPRKEDIIEGWPPEKQTPSIPQV